MFTYDQAIAVTDAQRSALSPVQETALYMVLNPWEDKPVDFRGTFTPVVKEGKVILFHDTLIKIILFMYIIYSFKVVWLIFGYFENRHSQMLNVSQYLCIFSGRSLGVAVQHCPFLYLFSILIMLLLLSPADLLG